MEMGKLQCAHYLEIFFHPFPLAISLTKEGVGEGIKLGFHSNKNMHIADVHKIFGLFPMFLVLTAFSCRRRLVLLLWKTALWRPGGAGQTASRSNFKLKHGPFHTTLSPAMLRLPSIIPACSISPICRRGPCRFK